MKVLNIRRIQIFTLFFSILDLLCLYGFIQAIQIFMDRLIAGHRIDTKRPTNFFKFTERNDTLWFVLSIWI